MSNKKSLLSSLQKIKNLFKDEATSKSVEILIKKVNTLEEEDDVVNTTRSFPLPKELKSKTDYAVFSDGACRGNPGPGSWGVMAQNSEETVLFEASSFDEHTTNNRMELLGAQKGLEILDDYLSDESIDSKKIKVYLYSDSNYVVQGLNSWRHNWKKKGWRKSDNKAVDNQAYWQGLDAITEKFSAVQAVWVKGHANHPQNERCDELCNLILDREGF